MSVVGVALDARASDPAVEVRRIGGPSLRAVDVAGQNDTIWIASNGGGLVRVEGGQAPIRIDLMDGLPSSEVLQVELDGRSRILAGLRGGLVVLDSAEAAPRPLAPPPAYSALAGPVTADLVVASRREARAVFQLTQNAKILERGPVATLWRLQDDEITPWTAPLGPGAQATASSYDGVNDCLLVAGVRPGPDRRQVPWLARDCPGGVEAVDPLTNAPEATIGIAALVRDIGRDVIVLAVVTQTMLNPASRRFLLVEAMQDGTLRPHCSGFSERNEVIGLAIDDRGVLLVASYGVGLRSVDCSDARKALFADDQRLRPVAAISRSAEGKLIIGTDDAVFTVAVDGRMSAPILESPERPVWRDSRPTALRSDSRAVLASSASSGLLELVRKQDEWIVERHWRPGIELPPAVFGPAIYATDGELVAVARSQGLLRLVEGEWRRQGPEQGLRAPHVQQLAAVPGLGIWIAFGSTPFDRTAAGLQLLRDDGTMVDIAMPEVNLQPGDALLAWADGRVWAATPLGVVEADPLGHLMRLSSHRVNGIFRNEVTGAIAAVGSTIERWTGQRFEPVIFRVEGPSGAGPLGHPVEVVVDDRGRWLVLYSRGRIVLLDEQREFLAVLGPEAGIPSSTAKLLYLRGTGDVILGTAREGMHLLRLP